MINLRINNILQMLKNVERTLFHNMFRGPPREFALTYVNDIRAPEHAKKISIKDIIGDGILLAVPKFRRTLERRWQRKFGSPEYIWKMLVPKSNIKVCQECGHHHERGRLCGHCYKKVENETNEIKEKIQEKLAQTPIDKDVIVLYEGEHIPEQPKEFWKGKRIIEMKKTRPQWFSKNLLQKSTQEPSTSTDVKPTDLA
ncbi:mitochondrial ribosomal protein L32 [Aphomia sociella]